MSQTVRFIKPSDLRATARGLAIMSLLFDKDRNCRYWVEPTIGCDLGVWRDSGGMRCYFLFAPKATVCSSVWVWDKFLVPEIKKIEAGNWKPAPYGAFIEMGAGGSDIAGFGPAVAKNNSAQIMAERDAIMKGKQIYAGPLSDRDGKERVAAGSVLNDADLWKMDWYVKGVTAQK